MNTRVEKKITDWVNHYPEYATPRSLPYKQGIQTGYDKVMHGRAVGQPPYKVGTPECDAWFSGVDRGKDEAARQREEEDAA